MSFCRPAGVQNERSSLHEAGRILSEIRHQLFLLILFTRAQVDDATSKATRCESTKKRLSKKEHRADALAPEADEGRDKLRKAAGRSKYPLIRRYPNGETRLGKA